MKRWIWLWVCISLLTGCAKQNAMEDALVLRSAIMGAKNCSFSMGITADYGDCVYEFAMDCVSDNQGNVNFTVTYPQSIAGITGTITADGGKLTFGDTALYIPMLTDDQITPVSAPWILMRTLLGGCITSCAEGRITIDDSYEADALKLDILLTDTLMPDTVDVYWKNRRILVLKITSFALS